MLQLEFTEIKSKETIPQINVMRFMGNKQKLLNFIIPCIVKETKRGDTIFDLFAGTHSVGYALKERNKILSNDILISSYIIGKALIENNSCSINSIEAEKDLRFLYEKNIEQKYYSFFEEKYSNTYFATNQCRNIDSIRFAIENVQNNEYKKALYLTALIYAMCYTQSTPGHFAQYMPANHPRIIELQKINIWDIFIRKCDELKICFSDFENRVFNYDYRIFFQNEGLKRLLPDISLFYIDPPYTGEQYSRFYHLLETMVKYDRPSLSYKGLYREDRFKSKFCYLRTVADEFSYLLEKISKLRFPKVIISYANTGLISKQNLFEICKNYFKNVCCEEYLYPHSTQGKGVNGVIEFLFICKN